MRISGMQAVTALLLTATVTVVGAQQMSQPAHTVSSNTQQSMANVYGEPKTRAEVRADLELWKRAGLDDFHRGENTPDTFSREYRKAYAEYVRMRSGPEYQQEVERQSAM